MQQLRNMLTSSSTLAVALKDISTTSAKPAHHAEKYTPFEGASTALDGKGNHGSKWNEVGHIVWGRGFGLKSCF